MHRQAAVLKREIEAKLANRIPAALSPLAQQAPRLHPISNAQLDNLLWGGFPLGSVCELTRFAIQLALSSHVAIPRENEPDFLTEADAVFLPQPKQKARGRKANKPTLVSPPAKKATSGKKKIAA